MHWAVFQIQLSWRIWLSLTCVNITHLCTCPNQTTLEERRVSEALMKAAWKHKLLPNAVSCVLKTSWMYQSLEYFHYMCPMFWSLSSFCSAKRKGVSSNFLVPHTNNTFSWKVWIWSLQGQILCRITGPKQCPIGLCHLSTANLPVILGGYCTNIILLYKYIVYILFYKYIFLYK